MFIEEVVNLTVNDRITKLIEILAIKNKDFAERINVKPNTLSVIRMNQRNVTERMANDICREFGVNESWLLNGDGDVFKSDSTNYIGELVKHYHLNEKDRMILETYVNMDEQNRDLFYRFIKSMNVPVSDNHENQGD